MRNRVHEISVPLAQPTSRMNESRIRCARFVSANRVVTSPSDILPEPPWTPPFEPFLKTAQTTPYRYLGLSTPNTPSAFGGKMPNKTKAQVIPPTACPHGPPRSLTSGTLRTLAEPWNQRPQTTQSLSGRRPQRFQLGKRGFKIGSLLAVRCIAFHC